MGNIAVMALVRDHALCMRDAGGHALRHSLEGIDYVDLPVILNLVYYRDQPVKSNYTRVTN